MKQFYELQRTFRNLSHRDQKLAIAMFIILTTTLFYIVIWEPLHLNYEKQQSSQITQTETYSWMQNAAAEVRSLRTSGSRPGKAIKTNSPVSIVAEQSANISGLKKQISKIESSGNNGAQIKIENASFDQLLLWINNLKLRNGIDVSSANIERSDEDGRINARLTLNRN